MANNDILTKLLIEEGFRKLGLSENMQLEVHSSLRSFGYVDGGALTIISALMNRVTENGSIVMSTFLMSPQSALTELDIKLGLKCKIMILSPNSDEKSGMGIISDTFRKMPNVVTGNGIFRVSAWGREKEINSQGYSNLIEKDGWALLLGVDIYRLSSMHYVEAKLPKDIKDIFKPSEEIRKLYPPEQWYIETGVPPVKAWYTIQNEAYERGYIKDTIIGKSKCMFFKINNVIGLYKQKLEKDPLGLYGLR